MKPKKVLKTLIQSPLAIVVGNLLLMMLLFTFCRVFFFLIYRDTFADMTLAHFVEICVGGLRFDLSALLLFNSPYILLALLPLPWRDTPAYQTVLKALFLTINILLLVVNCADMAYFPFTNRRTTITFFSEFSNDANLLKNHCNRSF